MCNIYLRGGSFQNNTPCPGSEEGFQRSETCAGDFLAGDMHLHEVTAETFESHKEFEEFMAAGGGREIE
jgi:hypothetical protein